MLGADYMEVLSQVEILTQYTKLKKKLQLYEKFQPGLKISWVVIWRTDVLLVEV